MIATAGLAVTKPHVARFQDLLDDAPAVGELQSWQPRLAMSNERSSSLGHCICPRLICSGIPCH